MLTLLHLILMENLAHSVPAHIQFVIMDSVVSLNMTSMHVNQVSFMFIRLGTLHCHAYKFQPIQLRCLSTQSLSCCWVQDIHPQLSSFVLNWMYALLWITQTFGASIAMLGSLAYYINYLLHCATMPRMHNLASLATLVPHKVKQWSRILHLVVATSTLFRNVQCLLYPYTSFVLLKQR